MDSGLTINEKSYITFHTNGNEDMKTRENWDTCYRIVHEKATFSNENNSPETK